MGIAYIVMGAKADAWNGKAVSATVCPDGQNGASSLYRKSLCIVPVYFSDSTGQKASP